MPAAGLAAEPSTGHPNKTKANATSSGVWRRNDMPTGKWTENPVMWNILCLVGILGAWLGTPLRSLIVLGAFKGHFAPLAVALANIATICKTTLSSRACAAWLGPHRSPRLNSGTCRIGSGPFVLGTYKARSVTHAEENRRRHGFHGGRHAITRSLPMTPTITAF